jgi:high-affinity nickel permease
MEPAIASGRFAAQVALRLPRSQEQPPALRALELSWKMVPVGLLFVLAFVQTVFIVAGVLRVALWLGVGGDVAGVVFPSSAGGVSFPDVFALSQASLVDAFQMTIGLVRSGAALAWLPVLNVLLLVVIGMLYWSWLASWWVRRRHQQLTASNGLG